MNINSESLRELIKDMINKEDLLNPLSDDDIAAQFKKG